MKANRVLGIIFSNAYDEVISELTNMRTMGSVPFAGRYRLIDFVLSNMVNCGIDKVGVITNSNFQSLMDHLGTGKPWDLSRKTAGMYLLPPFNEVASGYKNRISALNNISDFMSKSVEEYVLMADCNSVYSFDYGDMITQHMKNGADVTIAYNTGKVPVLEDVMTYEMNEEGKITSIAVGDPDSGEANYAIGAIMMNKSLLLRLLHDASVHNKTSFERDILIKNINSLKLYGFKAEGFCRTIDSLRSYYDTSMALLKKENCAELFNQNRPVYTKVKDDMPTIYGLGSSVKNSRIADGCVIEGEVENCILFRGVKIAKGVKVKNSIIMQGSYISENANLDCVILDKNVTVKPGKKLAGTVSFPIYVGKNIVV